MEDKGTGAKVLELVASNTIQELEIPFPVVVVLVVFAGYGVFSLGYQAYKGIQWLLKREEV